MTYRLIDSGNGRKLEDLSGVLVDRQAPSAIWKPSLPEQRWQEVRGRHVRTDRGGGYWEWRGREPDRWPSECGPNRMLLKATPFGHIGLFAEQVEQWRWIEATCRGLASELGRQPEILNLFAYTGGSTVAAARGGAAVTHVDAARGVVDWARDNATLNELEKAPVRWIVEDCALYCRRERRRKNNYDGVILDPPSFGRGKKSEVWKIEDQLDALLEDIRGLVGEAPGMMLLTCHTPGFTPIGIQQLLDDRFASDGQELEAGEMWVPEEGGRRLPSGFYARRRPRGLQDS